VDGVGADLEVGEPVAAGGQDVVHGDVVAGGRVERCAVDAQVADGIPGPPLLEHLLEPATGVGVVTTRLLNGWTVNASP
jgi:hypothetical protein